MKEISIIGLLLFLFTFTGLSQKIYSVENLEQASQEDLNTYLDDSLKLKKDGKTVTIIGAAALGAAVLWGITGPLDHELGTVLEAVIIGIVGIAAMLVGITMNVTNNKRVERINTIKDTAYDGVKIDLKPCAQYNLASQNYQPVVTLRVRFKNKKC